MSGEYSGVSGYAFGGKILVSYGAKSKSGCISATGARITGCDEESIDSIVASTNVSAIIKNYAKRDYVDRSADKKNTADAAPKIKVVYLGDIGEI